MKYGRIMHFINLFPYLNFSFEIIKDKKIANFILWQFMRPWNEIWTFLVSLNHKLLTILYVPMFICIFSTYAEIVTHNLQFTHRPYSIMGVRKPFSCFLFFVAFISHWSHKNIMQIELDFKLKMYETGEIRLHLDEF